VKTARAVVWALAIFVALAAARYFILPDEFLEPPVIFPDPAAVAGARLGSNALHIYPMLFLTHVGCGIVALIVGLPQFNQRLRTRRPSLHRRAGVAYLIAVALSAAAVIPLAALIPTLVPVAFRSTFLSMAISFFILGIVWAITSGIAFQRARSRRFQDHRAWMMRSYSLTFAAVSVRLVATVLSLATGNVIFGVNGGVLSWPVNLIVAEWLIRREPQPTFVDVVA